MKFSTKLTKAAAAFVICGTVASTLPNSGMMVAGACGGSTNHTASYVAGTAVVGGLIYGASTGAFSAGAAGAGAGAAAGAKKKKHDPNAPTTTTTGDQSTNLGNFIYNPNP